MTTFNEALGEAGSGGRVKDHDQWRPKIDQRPGGLLSADDHAPTLVGGAEGGGEARQGSVQKGDGLLRRFRLDR